MVDDRMRGDWRCQVAYPSNPFPPHTSIRSLSPGDLGGGSGVDEVSFGVIEEGLPLLIDSRESSKRRLGSEESGVWVYAELGEGEFSHQRLYEGTGDEGV